MKRSRLKNKANKTKDPTDIRNYKKQRNHVVNLNKEAKLEYFSKYDSNDSKLFWVNCKPCFTNKYNKADTDIILSENGELILKTRKLRILSMIILYRMSTTLVWITGMIIPCHRRWVLVGLIISSNGIKTTPAQRILCKI